MKRKEILKFLIPITILFIISILDMIGSEYTSNIYDGMFIKQLIWIIIFYVILFLSRYINFNWIKKYHYIFYLLGIISLILVLFVGKTINGASSWFKLGPFSFQPSELFKYFYLITVSVIASKNYKPFKKFMLIILLTILPCLLIFLQPDTGLVIIFLFLMLGVLLESDIPKKYIYPFIIFGITLVGGVVAIYFINKDILLNIFGTNIFYRMDRIINYTENTSYQLNNALIGMGASGLFGLGFKSIKIYIPEATTDFIFATSICNFGYIMGLFIILIYTYLLYKLNHLKKRENSKFNKAIINGIYYMMFIQIYEHIFMNIGLLPITGITLPFLSYGGSSLISYALIFSLIIKITTNNSSYN